jgi:MFS family permease
MAVSRSLNSAKSLLDEYPRQLWVLVIGMLISATGGSMIWPFLTIYVRQRLEIPLATIGLLLGLHSAAALVTTLIAGPVADRLGRKGVMLLSLFSSAAIYVVMSRAGSLPLWAVLMTANGALNPLFRVGSDAMVADLVPPERRAGAYAIIRVGNNLGIAIGPAVGGFVASVSYAWAFYAGALASVAFGLLVLVLVRETLPAGEEAHGSGDLDGGYGRLVRDTGFLAFCAVSTLAVIPSALMMVLLPVYGKEEFGVVESQYGFIMATNAAMVVLFQYAVTRTSERHSPWLVMALAALLYAVGVGSVALGSSFAGFLLSMIIMTGGELLLVPTGTTIAANLSPADMRGRYMGFYGLTWRVGIGIGPVLGGLLNDQIAPTAIWYGGAAFGLLAAVGFLLLGRLVSQGTTDG